MALDLRDLLRFEMRVHPRLAQQGLFEGAEARAQIAATIPPLVPFGEADYAGALWVIDWDHKLPSRHAALRLYAYYTPERRREPRLINPVAGNRRADARGAIIYVANCLRIPADNLRM